MMDLPSMEISWLWTVFLLLLVGVLFYCLLPKPRPFWEKMGVPGVRDTPFLADLKVIFMRKDIHNIDLERLQEYGRMYGVQEGGLAMLVISDPDLIRNILIKDFTNFSDRTIIKTDDPIFDAMLTGQNGDAWKRIRCIISPTFSTGKIKRMTDIIVSSAKVVVQNIIINGGKPVDAKEYFNTFTMDVIASVAFGAKIHSYQDPNNRFLQEARKIFRNTISWRLILFILSPRLMKFLGVSLLDNSSSQFFKKVTLEILEERRKTGKVGNDFLQLIMDCAKEVQEQEETQQNDEKHFDEFNVDHFGDDDNAQIFKMTKETKSLNYDELIAQCVMFFLVGYATTAATLTFAAYSLALNPKIQDKLREEVDAVIAQNDGKLTYESIQSMKYLDKVILETLRMFPAIIRVARIAAEDYKLGDTGIVIEKGQVVAIPIYAVQHDPEIYPEPEKFNPERFSFEEKAKRHPHSYLTFGAGPRNCVGMRFALMEVKLCIAYIVSQLIIKRCPETQVPPIIFSAMAFLEPKDIMLCFEERKNSVLDKYQEN